MKTTLPLRSTERIASAFTAPEITAPRHVTARAFWLGLLLSMGLGALNCWIEIVANVHFLGGVQIPFGAVFVLGVLVALNIPLRAWGRASNLAFSPTELLTIYAMSLFGALISTPGADNFFITVGPNLFYFASRENNWAELFYKFIPSWMAPGWDGQSYNREVIEPLFNGGLTFSQIPWHAWTMMLIAWSVLLLLVYATLFFASLLLRKQWIENEALAFPLVQLPLQMVQVDQNDVHPPARAFWGNPMLWTGVAIAFGLHFTRGMSQYFPDWPPLIGFQSTPVSLAFTEKPWNAIGGVNAQFYLGAIGIAFLLTREVAFSFWVFFFLISLELVIADALGFSPATLPKDGYSGRPTFVSYQSVGGWLMMAAALGWAARKHLAQMARAAFRGEKSLENEPFSPRFVVFGFLLSFAGLLAWSEFAGISPLLALLFFGFYLVASLVLARLVVEGGLLFPQIAFSPLEVMSSALVGTPAIGAASLTKLSFLQPSLFMDMRTNVLPGFLHTLKIAHSLDLDARHTRRLMASIAAAIIVTLGVTILTSIWTLYAAGGLTGYSWFTQSGGRSVFSAAAAALAKNAGVEPLNLVWMSVGAAIVLALIFTRSRLAWFPLHPLGFIVATTYPITKLWFSFFLGWALKTLLNRYGGHQSVQKVQPLMIGLILGNIAAMMLWMLLGLWQGVQIQYWPA